MQLIKLYRKQGGDTIVEVLIAIAVVSAVLGSAYAITNRNVQNSRQTQEHGQALKAAESQLELLKSFIADGKAAALPAAGSNFCMYVDTVPNPDENKVGLFTGAGTTIALPTVDANYPASCKIDEGISADRYMAGIKQDPTTLTYTVSIAWDGATGGRDKVSLMYKVYP
jgi:type II secretory pathway pseudopilin PulG